MSNYSRRCLPGLCSLLLVLLVALPQEAYASYVDPGAGTLVYQIILAAFFGAVFYFRKGIGALLALLHLKKQEEKNHKGTAGDA